MRLGNLYAYIQHPYVIKRELAVIASEDIELSFNDVGSVSTAGSWSIICSLNLLPMILFNVKHMHIVHPMRAIIATEVVYLGVD